MFKQLCQVTIPRLYKSEKIDVPFIQDNVPIKASKGITPSPRGRVHVRKHHRSAAGIQSDV